MVPNHKAENLWNALKDAGVTPCGLACRDSLRIEFGLPLYGQELSEHIHPFITRYAWVVKFDHDFIGKTALLKLKETTELSTVGLQLDSPMIARPHYKIKEGGEITSGTRSPLSGKSIALAMVPKEYSKLNSKVTVIIRNKEVSATVTPVPFV